MLGYIHCTVNIAIFSELICNLHEDKDDKENEILELHSKLSKCNSEMTAISNNLSDAEESMNKLLEERSEYILTNMKKLNKEQKSQAGIGTNSNNHKALLQGEAPSILILNLIHTLKFCRCLNQTISTKKFFHHTYHSKINLLTLIDFPIKHSREFYFSVYYPTILKCQCMLRLQKGWIYNPNLFLTITFSSMFCG